VKPTHLVNPFYLRKKLSELRHRRTHCRADKWLRASLERYHGCADRKPAAQIKHEMRLCRRFWQCYPHHYYRYDLYRRDRQLADQALIDYIPTFFYYDLFLWRVNPREYAVLLDDKIISEQFFMSLSIARPHAICWIVDGRLYDSGMNSQTYRDVERELAASHCEKIFLKPSKGQGGAGILVGHRIEKGQFRMADGAILSEPLLRQLGSRGSWVVQTGIVQDPEMGAFHPDSVNTCRVATKNTSGEVSVVCATLRMGRGDNEVDNGSVGGLFVGIDERTGELHASATSHRCDRFESHPDTHLPFRGHKLSKWAHVKQFVLTSAAKMPQFTYVGWDVAVSKDGPLAVEANVPFGLAHFQIAFGGLREAFDIHNPRKYWTNRPAG